MNHIYKKVWNRVRGCFVVVSETASSISRNKGKVTSLILVTFLAASNVFALTTHNGDVELGTLRDGEKRTLVDSFVINGNATANTPELYISWTSRNFRGMENQSLLVNGNLDSSSPLFAVVHKGDGASKISGSLEVTGNLNLHSGLLRVGSGNTDDGGEVTSSLNVHGTLNISNGAQIDNRADYHHVKLQLNAGVLDSSGLFDISSVESGTVNYGDMTVRNGNYQQSGNVQTYVSNNIALLGGTLNNQDALNIGGKSGNFSAGNSLNLAGGILTNRNLLTQVGGSISVTAGSYDFGTLNKSNGVLSNAATLVITNFNQSNGTASNSGNLTIANANLGGSLTNTGTLSLTGNVTTRGNLTSTGTLNNRGSWTETAHYAISGNLTNTGSVNFQNGFEFAANGRLNSSGTLQTNNAANVFDSLGTQGQTALSTVSLQAALSEEVKTSLTDLFRHYVPGTVAQSLIDHASFTGGKVIVTGVNLTTTQRDDLLQAFKAKFFLPDAFTSAVSQQC